MKVVVAVAAIAVSYPGDSQVELGAAVCERSALWATCKISSCAEEMAMK